MLCILATNLYKLDQIEIVLLEAMDQPGHVARFLLYRHFTLCNPIFIKIKTGNLKLVELNGINYYTAISNENVENRIRYRGESRANLLFLTDVSYSRTVGVSQT